MNCDGIARWYRFLEFLAFGGALQRRRREYVNEVAGASRVLILGDGDGRFTEEFLRRSAAAEVDSVDLSASMLALAGRRVGSCPSSRMRVRFHHSDARTIKLPGTYDLIVSHFFLDCFTPDEMPAFIAHIAQAACPQARWLVSEFSLPNTGIGRRIATFLLWVMYWFFRVSTGLQASRLPDYGASLAGQGFRRVRRKSAWGGFLVSELWERSL